MRMLVVSKSLCGYVSNQVQYNLGYRTIFSMDFIYIYIYIYI